MYIIIGFSILVTLSVSGLSMWHHQKQRDTLTRELEAEGQYIEKARKAVGLDGAAVTTVTTFDVLYNTLKMDPRTLEGMDHLHHARDFESLGDVKTYVNNGLRDGDISSGEWEDVIDKYKGYTGEQHVFGNTPDENLQIPESGTHEGYDAVMNGDPVDVKTTANPQEIHDYLDSHPPSHKVVVPRELREEFGGHPRVIVDRSLSVDEAYDATESTFEGLHDLGEVIEAGPVIALAVNSARNVQKVRNGTKDVGTAVEHTAWDTAGAGGGAFAGGKIGLTIGFALAPVTGGTSAVVIPTASSFLGTVIGILTGKGISGWIKERHLRKAKKKLQKKATQFRNSFLKNMDAVFNVTKLFYRSRLDYVELKEDSGESALKRKLFPSLKTKFLEMCGEELRSEYHERSEYYNHLARKIERKDPEEGGLILFAQGKPVLNGIEPLPSIYDSLSKRLDEVREEKKKLE